MPHDVYGKLLNVGDSVMVPAKIKEIHQTEEYCNVTLETTLKMWPAENCSILNLNARQIVKQNPLEAHMDAVKMLESRGTTFGPEAESK